MAHGERGGKGAGENLREGIVITKYGHSEGDIPRMTIYEAAHPIPDEVAWRRRGRRWRWRIA